MIKVLIGTIELNTTTTTKKKKEEEKQWKQQIEKERFYMMLKQNKNIQKICLSAWQLCNSRSRTF